MIVQMIFDKKDIEVIIEEMIDEIIALAAAKGADVIPLGEFACETNRSLREIGMLVSEDEIVTKILKSRNIHFVEYNMEIYISIKLGINELNGKAYEVAYNQLYVKSKKWQIISLLVSLGIVAKFLLSDSFELVSSINIIWVYANIKYIAWTYKMVHHKKKKV